MSNLVVNNLIETMKTYFYGKYTLNAVKNLPYDVKRNSIILIGPMGTGKSSTARILSKFENKEKISLDDRKQLSKYYAKGKKFKNSKNFEFFLTTSVLGSLESPSIIDFGAGHSIYPNKNIKKLFEEIISYFPNTILLLPTKNIVNPDGTINISENEKILMDRIKHDNYRFEGKGHTREKTEINAFFLRNPSNYKLAKYIIYENGKTPDKIALEIDGMINRER